MSETLEGPQPNTPIEATEHAGLDPNQTGPATAERTEIDPSQEVNHEPSLEKDGQTVNAETSTSPTSPLTARIGRTILTGIDRYPHRQNRTIIQTTDNSDLGNTTSKS